MDTTEAQTSGPLERLEYLRGEIEAERISMSEVAELQSLAEYIDPSDTVLLEWAGVPENPEDRGDILNRAVRDAYCDDDLETLAARFERNADDWSAIGGNPDLANVRGAGFATGMAEAWRLAADEIRRVLRRDPDYLDLTNDEKGGITAEIDAVAHPDSEWTRERREGLR